MKRFIFISIVVVMGGIIFIFFPSCSKANEKKASKATVEALAGNAKKDPDHRTTAKLSSVKDVVYKVDKINSGIKVPSDLQDCPDKYFAKNADFTCSKQEYCSYYKAVKGKQTTYHNLEFTNECSLCKYHKKIGTIFYKADKMVYTHLGYQKGKCYQGMYKGQ